MTSSITSPWITILEVLFIGPHFPLPALTPAAFLCLAVWPRKLSGRGFISLFYHLELEESSKHRGRYPLSPTDSLLIDRAGQQHIQTLFYALRCAAWNASASDQTHLERFEWGGFGEVGAVKGPDKRITVVLITQFFRLGVEQKAGSLQDSNARKAKGNCTFPVRTEGNSVSNLLLSPNLRRKEKHIKWLKEWKYHTVIQ